MLKKNTVKLSKLPIFFKPLFWSLNFQSIDLKKNKRNIIINTINYGDWKHWRWITKNYGKKNVKKTITKIPASEFRPAALTLASILFSLKKINYASRGAKSGKKKNPCQTS